MADLRLFANTSNIVRFILKHSTTGQGLTGLTSASAGLIISTIADNEATATAYTVAGSTIEGITTLGTFATPTATKCRFKEVDATNHKGLYEFQFADARFAVASSRRLVISVTGAANLLDTDYEIQLVRFDPYDAVRLGLTALPNVAAAGNGGLPTVDASNAVKVQSGTGANQISLSSGTVTLTDSSLTSAKFGAGAITADVIATDAIDNDAIAANAVTEIQSGLATAAVLTTVAGYLDTEIAAILADTNELQTDWADGGRLDLILDGRATPAQVNTEIVDALNVDTYAEPGQEAPPATTTLAKKIGYLYKAFRNRKTQTDTTLKLYADNGTTVDQKATISSDGTTYDHSEIGTGP